MSLTIRKLTADTLPLAAEVLAAAFFDDPGFHYLVPRDDHRKRWLPVTFAETLHVTLPNGQTYITTDETDRVRGVIAATPPGKYPHGAWADFRLFWGSFWKPRPWVPSLGALWPILKYLKSAEQMHPQDPHWYVYVIGVDPGHQGKGIGRQLMRVILDQADRDGVFTYLETETEIDVRFYRSLGFDVTETRNPADGGPPLHGMTRGAGATRPP